MERKCINCNIKMNKASIRPNCGYVLVLEKEPKKLFNSEACGVDSYVCSKCGHVELVAEKPDIFNM